MRTPSFFTAAAGLAFLGAFAPAQAETATFYFGAMGPDGKSQISGQITYELADASVAADAATPSDRGQRLRYDGLATISVSTAWDQQTYTGAQTTISVWNDYLYCYAPQGPACGAPRLPEADRLYFSAEGGIGERFSLYVVGPDQAFLQSGDLPSLLSLPPRPVQYEWQINDRLFEGMVTVSATPFAQPSPIPEPATALMLLAGLPVLLACAGRRRAAQVLPKTVMI